MSTDIDTKGESEAEQRYGVLETGEGDVVIYDREQPSAWLQSDVTIDCVV